jgi:hypothetical protein
MIGASQKQQITIIIAEQDAHKGHHRYKTRPEPSTNCSWAVGAVGHRQWFEYKELRIG